MHVKEEICKQQNSCLHQCRERGHLGRKAPPPEKKRADCEDQRVASRQSSRPLLISLKVEVTMGLDLQPGGLTAGLVGHYQLDKISIVSEI